MERIRFKWEDAEQLSSMADQMIFSFTGWAFKFKLPMFLVSRCRISGFNYGFGIIGLRLGG